jgi:hypothetical protein
MQVEHDPYSEELSELIRSFRAKEINSPTFWQGMEQLWREEGERFVKEQEAHEQFRGHGPGSYHNK